MQKLIGELLVGDCSRKGFIDGRSVRLPTIVVRPGKPNAAASSFASGIIREPLAGEAAVCPEYEKAAYQINVTEINCKKKSASGNFLCFVRRKVKIFYAPFTGNNLRNGFL